MTYAPLVISAVNHSTGVFTCVGHGLITGGGFSAFPDGPSWGGALYAPSGGVIPTGLAPVTTYWPIRTDADHFKLASSNANAMAGTALTFSSDGTLPLQFLVGLPYELPRISAAGVQVFADDFNTEWQALKALWALLTGQAQSLWSAVTLAVSLALTAGLKLVSSSGKSVTHVAPAGLAADYTLTWPAGIPTARSPAFVDSTGAISTGKTTYYSAALAAPAASGPTFTSSPPFFNIGSSGVAVVCPIWEAVGSTITTLQALVEKTSNATFTVQAVLHDTNVAAFTRTTTLIGSNNANNPGSVNVGASGLSIAVVAGHVYELHVNESTGAPGAGLDGVIGWSVTI